MLKCGESRDATALFESHHPFTNRKYLENVMAKYEVDPTKVECILLDEADKEAVFDWPEFESKSSTDVQPPVSDFVCCVSPPSRAIMFLFLTHARERRRMSSGPRFTAT